MVTIGGKGGGLRKKDLVYVSMMMFILVRVFGTLIYNNPNKMSHKFTIMGQDQELQQQQPTKDHGNQQNNTDNYMNPNNTIKTNNGMERTIGIQTPNLTSFVSEHQRHNHQQKQQQLHHCPDGAVLIPRMMAFNSTDEFFDLNSKGGGRRARSLLPLFDKEVDTIFSFVKGNYTDLVDIWYYHYKKHQICGKLLCLVALDNDAYAFLKQRFENVPDTMIISGSTSSSSTGNATATVNTDDLHNVWVYRVSILNRILKTYPKWNVLLTDLDALWLRNPYTLIFDPIYNGNTSSTLPSTSNYYPPNIIASRGIFPEKCPLDFLTKSSACFGFIYFRAGGSGGSGIESHHGVINFTSFLESQLLVGAFNRDDQIGFNCLLTQNNNKKYVGSNQYKRVKKIDYRTVTNIVGNITRRKNATTRTAITSRMNKTVQGIYNDDIHISTYQRGRGRRKEIAGTINATEPNNNNNNNNNNHVLRVALLPYSIVTRFCESLALYEETAPPVIAHCFGDKNRDSKFVTFEQYSLLPPRPNPSATYNISVAEEE